MSGSYKRLLARADEHFRKVAAAQPVNVTCGSGCSFCCYGLFEISAADVVVIGDALDTLDPRTRSRLVRKARKIVKDTAHPAIGSISEEDKEAFFDQTAVVPCPALGDDGCCEIYESRPLVCRTFGLPLRDGDQTHDEVCELNFQEAAPGELQSAAWNLQWEDVVGSDDQYTVPQAIVLAAQSRRR
ncbi:MAG TPA: YkgJ family cysteine cluster protein [Thermoanaerobaculia bacterium]|nr:YkgJ family cysteine cluster protein [Thermoanaerobaculia bacterium]